jgi:hypothetical protein
MEWSGDVLGHRDSIPPPGGKGMGVGEGACTLTGCSTVSTDEDERSLVESLQGRMRYCESLLTIGPVCMAGTS